ncbi:hypothetical protein DMC47_04335 [Nostoc sp. 3335mG]|nr:hypothetical protein DMC47_04335 [Nostoc sp. 3335mG]
MIRPACIALALSLVSAVARAQPVPPISVPPAPPVAPQPMLIELVPGTVQCDDGIGPDAVEPVRLEQPFPVRMVGQPGWSVAPMRVQFRIDAQGRPFGISQAAIVAPAPMTGGGRFFYTGSDLMPALAASRFAAGQARDRCSMTMAARAFTANEAPVALVRRYLVSPHSRGWGEEAFFRRAHPADSDCFGAGSPKVRLRAMPVFETIPIEPGGRAYAMVGFDIDRQGRPIGVRIVESDGNPALDRASVDSVRRSRFAPEARQGCTYPYRRTSEVPLPAPATPDKATLTPADARCPAADTAWLSMPRLVFPRGFATRRVEGWAVIGYDVAPWGQTGNVRVLAAEPAAAFGDRAREIVTGARQAPSAAGRSGCVDLVRFVMPKPGREDAEDEAEVE